MLPQPEQIRPMNDSRFPEAACSAIIGENSGAIWGNVGRERICRAFCARGAFLILGIKIFLSNWRRRVAQVTEDTFVAKYKVKYRVVDKTNPKKALLSVATTIVNAASETNAVNEVKEKQAAYMKARNGDLDVISVEQA